MELVGEPFTGAETVEKPAARKYPVANTDVVAEPVETVARTTSIHETELTIGVKTVSPDDSEVCLDIQGTYKLRSSNQCFSGDKERFERTPMEGAPQWTRP